METLLRYLRLLDKERSYLPWCAGMKAMNFLRDRLQDSTLLGAFQVTKQNIPIVGLLSPSSVVTHFKIIYIGLNLFPDRLRLISYTPITTITIQQFIHLSLPAFHSWSSQSWSRFHGLVPKATWHISRPISTYAPARSCCQECCKLTRNSCLCQHTLHQLEG